MAQKDFIFKGANGKEKYPYELSEFLYCLIKNKALDIKYFKNFQFEIKGYRQFLLSKSEVKQKSKIRMNGLFLDSAITKLPTFYYLNKDKTFSEIVIQKQQYAAGFQAMVYFCIPTQSFSNSQEILGWTSKEKNIKLKYIIDEGKTEIILNLFKILAMASENHRQDAVRILKVLEKGFSV